MAKILLVEDDAFLIKIYKKKLEVEKFDVQVAEDGVTGLEKMKSFAPDLVLCDVMMPKMGGLEVLEKAKADPAISKIPILMLTNLSTSIDADAAVKKGAIGLLVKSDVTPSQVITKIKTILKL